MRTSVSVVIPAWNEAADIGECLEAIAGQDASDLDVEVILADGESSDDTAGIAKREAARLGLCLTVVDNPRRRTSVGLNAALASARGEVVVRIDARSRVPESYIRTCTQLLAERPDIGVVGGAQVAAARSAGVVEQGIARSLRNRWTTGLSRYRRSPVSGPTDTVWMGVFRATELKQLGGWDERVALNEDFELNQRYRAAGMVVWFEASLRSTYLPRQSLRALARQYFRFGRVKGTWWARGERPNARQAALLAVPPAGAVVSIFVVRRLGLPITAAAMAAGALAIDTAGGDGASPPAIRLISMIATLDLAGAWWTGVIAGFAGERLGIGHPHG
jgi:glycosyltransferase involved in cell wall biosynthesis